jgi:monofunctional biosynthetic peptidoglycan transglycosylase
LLRAAALLATCLLALQLALLARVALMAVIDPQSTTFQRSEAWRLMLEGRMAWSQEWVDDEAISRQLHRAVIASEDADFSSHAGIDWEAMEDAWDRNQRSQERAQRQTQRNPRRPVSARLFGGSTITQQLAKNLFLSGERHVLRKGQEAIITLGLELLLSKQRILEIYLNNVEWGEGVFGAQAAARHYFRIDASRLGAEQAARLAVLLPAPKRFERQPWSAYVNARVATIVARMGAVELP